MRVEIYFSKRGHAILCNMLSSAKVVRASPLTTKVAIYIYVFHLLYNTINMLFFTTRRKKNVIVKQCMTNQSSKNLVHTKENKKKTFILEK